MKKLNITKKQYDESKYFNNKYGSIKFVSESGKLFKTDKGVVLSLEASKEPFTMKEEAEKVPPADEKPVTEDIDEVEELVDDVETSDADTKEEDTINKEEVTAALADVVDTIKAIAEDNGLEVPGLVPEEDDEEVPADDEDAEDEELEDLDECDCKDGKCDCGKKLEKEGFLDMFKGKPKFKKGDKVKLKHAIGNLRGVWTVTNPDEFGEVGLVNDKGGEMTSPAKNLLKVAAECGNACECKNESAKRRARAKLVREAIAKRARIRKIKESIRRRAKARKVLESIKAKRAAKKMMESKKVRTSKKVARKVK